MWTQRSHNTHELRSSLLPVHCRACSPSLQCLASWSKYSSALPWSPSLHASLKRIKKRSRWRPKKPRRQQRWRHSKAAQTKVLRSTPLMMRLRQRRQILTLTSSLARRNPTTRLRGRRRIPVLRHFTRMQLFSQLERQTRRRLEGFTLVCAHVKHLGVSNPLPLVERALLPVSLSTNLRYHSSSPCLHFFLHSKLSPTLFHLLGC